MSTDFRPFVSGIRDYSDFSEITTCCKVLAFVSPFWQVIWWILGRVNDYEVWFNICWEDLSAGFNSGNYQTQQSWPHVSRSLLLSLDGHLISPYYGWKLDRLLKSMYRSKKIIDFNFVQHLLYQFQTLYLRSSYKSIKYASLNSYRFPK